MAESEKYVVPEGLQFRQIKSINCSKATVLKTLNILHKKFRIGIKLQYQVVVGTGNLMTI
jgi:hypothetical protein